MVRIGETRVSAQQMRTTQTSSAGSTGGGNSVSTSKSSATGNFTSAGSTGSAGSAGGTETDLQKWERLKQNSDFKAYRSYASLIFEEGFRLDLWERYAKAPDTKEEDRKKYEAAIENSKKLLDHYREQQKKFDTPEVQEIFEFGNKLWKQNKIKNLE
ncbi:hypothetical protein IKQ21_04815 [bacterium]|nr:hypothetical protein [bacterium]